jgi:hypothetical protein
MKKMIYLSMLLLLLGNCTQPIFANSKINTKQAPIIATQIKLTKGKQFKSQKETYAFLPGVVSAREFQVDKVTTIDTAAQPDRSAKHKVIDQDIIQKKGKYIIFKSGLSQLNSNLKALPVVLNERTKQYGILTGSIIIKFKDFENADKIKNQFNLIESKRYEHLNRIFYKTTPSETMIDMISQIKSAYPDCDIDIEILENFRVPQ